MMPPAGVGDASCNGMVRARTWACCGNMWCGLGGPWTTTQTAIRCSRWLRGRAKAGSNSREQQRIADRLTQIGRALRELGIGWIAAYSPQAKGRVERSFLTDQDRLIKLLRLAQVKTMQAANDFLEKEYWPEWNAKFTRQPS